MQLYLGDGLEELQREATLNGFLDGAVQDPIGAVKFVGSALLHRELMADLRPEAMAQRWRDNPQDRSLRSTHRSFVTVGPHPSQRRSDPLYQHLHQEISTEAGRLADPVAGRGLATLRAWPHVLHSDWGVAGEQGPDVRQPREPVQIGLADNDGVVDSARQLLLEDPDELAGVVLADHADVLGRYDDIDRLVDRKPLRSGAFHSGARFSDETFFTLYREVGRIIERSCTG